MKKASELGQLQEISAQNTQIIEALVRITQLLERLVELSHVQGRGDGA